MAPPLAPVRVVPLCPLLVQLLAGQRVGAVGALVDSETGRRPVVVVVVVPTLPVGGGVAGECGWSRG